MLILYTSGGTYSLKSAPTTDFLGNFSWQFYLSSEFLPEFCCNEIGEEILFSFCFDVWPGSRTLAFRLLLHFKLLLFVVIYYLITFKGFTENVVLQEYICSFNLNVKNLESDGFIYPSKQFVINFALPKHFLHKQPHMFYSAVKYSFYRRVINPE